MGFTADATGGIGLPILISGVIAAVGVVVLLPMTRHPISLPTYVGPPGMPSPPRPAPLATAPPRHWCRSGRLRWAERGVHGASCQTGRRRIDGGPIAAAHHRLAGCPTRGLLADSR